MFKLSAFTSVDTDSLIDLTSNRCSIEHRKFINSSQLMDINQRTLNISISEIGAHSTEEIPVPIPNTEVKLSGGENTATAGR